jgi:hypothetical protein
VFILIQVHYLLPSRFFTCRATQGTPTILYAWPNVTSLDSLDHSHDKGTLEGGCDKVQDSSYERKSSSILHKENGSHLWHVMQTSMHVHILGGIKQDMANDSSYERKSPRILGNPLESLPSVHSLESLNNHVIKRYGRVLEHRRQDSTQ